MAVIGKWLLQRDYIYSRTALLDIRNVAVLGRWLCREVKFTAELHFGILEVWLF